ncbi:MC2R [Mytilus coruscus]|uniref:MC2R n=1 Tax=Mytilus coruscus TaxID=42192 RepID=A0A6J8BJX5_MYTCO|nr:MC2R [Mytilus coruscus]
MPPAASIVISILMGFSITINAACIIACCRKMRRDFYWLSVLFLLLSDLFIALSCMWYGLTAFFQPLNQLVGMCLFHMFAFAFGSLTQYSIIFFICLQRLLTIKSYNFGTNKIFKEYRYLLMIGTICFLFLFALAVTLFTPFEKSIAICSSNELYGHNFVIYFAFIFGLGTILMLTVISITVITGIRIWKIFFSSHVYPVNIESKQRCSSHDREAEFSNQIMSNQETRCPHSVFLQYRDNYVGNDVIPNVIDIQPNGNKENNGVVMSSKRKRKVYSISSEPLTRFQRMSLAWKSDRHLDRKAWEIRAFSTCVIIAMSSVIFTGPFVASYWVEILTGTVIKWQTQVVLFILHMLNVVVDPFIYAWRIPEIKAQLKKSLKCRKRNSKKILVS